MENLYSRYAIALLDVAKEDKNDLVILRNEINVLLQIFKKEPRFARFLNTNSINLQEKYEVIDNVFKDFKLLIKNFIKLICKQNRGIFIYDIFKECLKTFDSYLNIEKGYVYSKTPLSEENMSKIKTALQNKKNKIIELENIVDENIIGGIKVTLANDIYDSTINKRLENMRKSLLKGGYDDAN